MHIFQARTIRPSCARKYAAECIAGLQLPEVAVWGTCRAPQTPVFVIFCRELPIGAHLMCPKRKCPSGLTPECAPNANVRQRSPPAAASRLQRYLTSTAPAPTSSPTRVTISRDPQLTLTGSSARNFLPSACSMNSVTGCAPG